MRFEPRAPDPEVNVSKTHPLAEASTLFAGLVAILVVATLLIAFAVEILIRFVPVEREVALFSGWQPATDVSADGPQADATDALLQRLVSHWPDAGYEFRLLIDESADPNAMALPGGIIIVTRGLLNSVSSENSLAFVLGHELGHFRNRDHIRQLGRGAAISLFVGAFGNSGGAISTSVADLTLRGFSREQERAADAFGLTLLQAEYGHVEGATHFFEMIDADRGDGVRFDNYLGTHPDPAQRVGALRELAADAGWLTTGTLVPWPAVDLSRE